MKTYVYYEDSGKIIQVSSQPPSGVLVGEPKAVEVGGPVDVTQSYVSGGVVVALPKSPDPNFSFNYATFAWEDMRTAEEKEATAKLKRAGLLADSDWTDTLSAKARLGEEVYDRWQAYRQALRDITGQPEYPSVIVWPTPPQ